MLEHRAEASPDPADGGLEVGACLTLLGAADSAFSRQQREKHE